MKILVIHGSMRRGNTYELTKEIMDNLAAKSDVELTEISVSDLDLPFCVSCHTCFSKGEEYCPDYSVMRSIESALLGCDGVILSGVTYLWSLNAAMKNILDHLAYLFHRPAFFGKKGMVIVTSAGAGEKHVAKYLKTVLGQWGINGAIMLTQNAKKHEVSNPAKVSAKLNFTADCFYKLIKSNKPLAPTIKNIVVHNAFRAMSLSEFSASERDAEHWRQSRFRDKAYPVKAGLFKYFVGAMIHGAAKWMTVIIGRRININKKAIK